MQQPPLHDFRRQSRNFSKIGLLQASLILLPFKSTCHSLILFAKLHGMSFMSGETYAPHLVPSHVSMLSLGKLNSSLNSAGAMQESKPIFQGKVPMLSEIYPRNSQSFSRSFHRITSSIRPWPTGLCRRKIIAFLLTLSP